MHLEKKEFNLILNDYLSMAQHKADSRFSIAICENCGLVVQVYDDQEEGDSWNTRKNLNNFGCCEEPDFQWLKVNWVYRK